MSLAAVMGELQNAYRTSQALVSGTAANLSAAEGSTRVDPVVQNNGLSGTSVIQVRAVDLLKFEGTLSTSSEAGTSGAVFKYNDQLNSLLLNPQKESFISKALVNFTNAFNITKGTVAANARSQIVAAAQTFTNQVTSYATGLQATKANLETDISNTIGNINSVVAKLSQVNQSLGSTSGNNKALDQRDSLLTLLSSYVSVQCQFGNNGIVTVRTTNGNDLVTDTSSYAQISYTQDLNLLSPNPASSTITIQTISASTSAPITTTTVSVDNVISGFGGQLAGFFTARNTTLPAALANINNATQQVMSQIDDLHNLGSGFPPAGSFTSNNTMYTTDLAAFTGTVNFAVTDANGDPVLDVNGRTVKPVTVDFDKLVSSSAAAPGQFTVQDVINEINQVAAGYSKASIGLGAVAIVPGAAQQYLIDQVRLVPTSNVAAGGQMSIDVELNSGSQFGTSFQVIGVQVFNAAGVAVVGQPALTATAFNLAAGQQSKTGQNIVVNLNAPDVQNLIRLEMRVIGADGTFETKYADFVVSGAGGGALGGAGSQIMNQRVEAIPSATAAAPLNVALGGGQVAANATAAKLGASLVSASFVDSNGLIVNTAGTAGYLKVSSVVGGGGIIIDPSTSEALPTNATRTTQSENFSHWFGLNNFFTADPVNPATNIAVNPTLVANPSQIAIGKAQALTSQINTMVPQTLPTALLNLTGNQPANGDSVTISGVQFNFWNGVGVAPANPVTVAATIPATLQNLYTVLKSYVGFTNTLTFAQPAAGANTMTIIAQSANANVAVTSVINGVGNLWQYADGLQRCMI